ncbi:unknown [Mamestra configurata nucleopolyhedrovirus A]|uniref:Uncharacterized protein n=1 Tax=Mamestra configurata nucleopolyhedrovirus TaxID=207830 RepID=Q8QLH9_NPVMC|nr:hypothetical protein McnAVgp055 [Mamestra configurata nucleopolyhedrovirus A]AAM09163.1 unknown [Mamestra configurata nucleopolyhedrovirus A]
MMNVVKMKSATQMLDVILNINTLVDTSKSNGQRLFYALCTSFINKSVTGQTALNTLKCAIDNIILIENALFHKRKFLDYALSSLADHSDGTNIQCQINVQCLDYLMKKYV